MKTVKALSLVLPLSIIIGCDNPANNVPKASVSADTNIQESGIVAASTSNDKVFAIGPGNGKIEFIGSKVTGSHKGGFTNFTGELRVADGNLIPGGNKIVIETASIWADNDRLTGHLKSSDFFNVAQFPNAEFVTSSIEKKATNYMVSGNLTLHGVTKQISFPAQILVSDQSVDVTSQFVLNRFDFGIKYSGKADDLVRKEVVIRLNVKGTPGKANSLASNL